MEIPGWTLLMTQRESWRKIRFFEARETGLVPRDSPYWVNPFESDLHRLVMLLYSFLCVCQCWSHHLDAFNFLPRPSIIRLPDLCLHDTVATYGTTELYFHDTSLNNMQFCCCCWSYLFVWYKTNMTSSQNLHLCLCLVAMTVPFALVIWRWSCFRL